MIPIVALGNHAADDRTGVRASVTSVAAPRYQPSTYALSGFMPAAAGGRNPEGGGGGGGGGAAPGGGIIGTCA